MAAIAGSADREAFAALFGYYAPRIKAQAMRFGLPADAAEDVAQDAMTAVWRRAAQFDPQRGSASAWVFAIAVNTRIDRLRREAKFAAHAPLDGAALEISGGEPTLEAGFDATRLQPLIAALPADQRRVVLLAFFRDASQSEIARLLGIPLGTVKSRIRLALAKLRAALEDE
ncbi:MAG: sigma-70 family RNA polymerase sigma factor [Hyphomicrobiales bacterium]|nr:sigma-70 family RNA polymerase sigma factor [Hyphomicrobiales bacterium]